jgi:hypothetical protein
MKRRRRRRYRGERFVACDICHRVTTWETARLVLVQGPARFAIAVGCTSEHAQEARRRWPLLEEELARIDFRQFVDEYPELAVTVAGLLELGEVESA